MILDNWLLMAFMGPITWAILNLISVYFAKEIFDSHYDGSLSCSLFQGSFIILPLLGIVEFHYNGSEAFLIGVLSGILFQLSTFYFLKSLFLHADVIVVQLIWNLGLALAPIFSYYILGQNLTALQILGIFIMFVGSSVIGYKQKSEEHTSFKAAQFVLLAVIFFSLGKTLEAKMFTELKTTFLTGYAYFSIGSLFMGTYIIIRRKANIPLLLNNFGKLSFVEFLTIFANTVAQRAIYLKGSSTYVILLEVFTPVFTYALILILLKLNFLFKEEQRAQRIASLKLQLTKLPEKILTLSLLIIGLCLVLFNER